MNKKTISKAGDLIQIGSEALKFAGEAGIPAVGLAAKFASQIYDKYLQMRFQKFISTAEIDNEMIERISGSEDYSNYLYSSLETVRQTHSKIGVIAIALIYKDHWNDEEYLIASLRSFSQISDKIIYSFIEIYDHIPEGLNYLNLQVAENAELEFHSLYREAIELIGRNFFVLTTGASMFANGPAQAMIWDHTKSYYDYCKQAIKILEK